MSLRPATAVRPASDEWALAGDVLARASREFRLCNSCGLCRRICAVFPAVELRTTVTSGDVAYLANLCHDCRACFAICPFKAKSKHDRGIDIPSSMAEVRRQTYASFARPRRLWRLLDGPRPVWLVAALTLAFFAIVTAATGDPARIVQAHAERRSFYHVIGYLWLVVPAGVMGIYAVSVVAAGVADFWRRTGARPRDLLGPRAHARAAADVLALRNLRGGDRGCAYHGDSVSSIRRRLHFAVFFGFAATFAATVAAAFEQEVLGRQPPYALLSAPVLLGTAGGLAIVAGCAGFLVFGRPSLERRKTEPARRLDRTFTVALGVAALSGLLTLALRSTPAMGPALIVHLGALGGLWVTFPYGKLVHAAYRYAALVRYHVDSQRREAEVASGAEQTPSRTFGVRA